MKAGAQKPHGGLIGSVGSGLEYLAAWTLGWFQDDSRSARRWRDLATHYNRIGSPSLNRMSLERAIEAAPEDVELRVELGWVLLESDDLEEARRVFEAALSRDYSHKAAVRGMGTTLHRLGKLSEAAYFYLSYLSQEPGEVEVLANLGIVLFEQGDFELAVERFRRALELKPQSVPIRVLLGRSLLRTGCLREAREVFSEAIELDPLNSEAHRLLGHVAENGREKAEAERLFGRAIELDPENPHAYLNLAQLLNMERREPARILQLARRAEEIFRRHGDRHGVALSLWEIGWAEYRSRNWKASAEASARALEADPTLQPVRFNRALALLRSGNVEDAEREYSTALGTSDDLSVLRTHAIADLREALQEDSEIAGGATLLERLERRDKELESQILQRAAVNSRPSASGISRPDSA